mmetsp:Transcript_37983/g.56842  ORF Transcript_37983/g.56842 Transcript_37983/m.56842 type:complete len:418 (-) Transcript_37983:9-1262(-)
MRVAPSILVTVATILLVTEEVTAFGNAPLTSNRAQKRRISFLNQLEEDNLLKNNQIHNRRLGSLKDVIMSSTTLPSSSSSTTTEEDEGEVEAKNEGEVEANNDMKPHPPNTPPPKVIVEEQLTLLKTEENAEEDVVTSDDEEIPSEKEEEELPTTPAFVSKQLSSEEWAEKFRVERDGKLSNIDIDPVFAEKVKQLGLSFVGKVVAPLFAREVRKDVPNDIVKGAAMATGGLTFLSGSGLAAASIASLGAAYVAVTPGPGGAAVRALGELAWNSTQLAFRLYKDVTHGLDDDFTYSDAALVNKPTAVIDTEVERLIMEAEAAVNEAEVAKREGQMKARVAAEKKAAADSAKRALEIARIASENAVEDERTQAEGARLAREILSEMEDAERIALGSDVEKILSEAEAALLEAENAVSI